MNAHDRSISRNLQNVTKPSRRTSRNGGLENSYKYFSPKETMRNGFLAHQMPKLFNVMSFRIEKGVRIEQEIRRILLVQAQRLIDDLQRKDVKEAIHEARKRCKRLRAILRLVRPLAEDLYQRENPAFRDMARSLSSLRDVDALAESFKDLVKREKFGGQCLMPLRAFLQSESEESGDRAAEVRSLVETATAAQKRMIQVRLPSGHDFELIGEGLLRSYRRGRRAMAAAYAQDEETTFHQWRKRVKDLNYQVEMLRDIWPPILKQLGKELHKLGDLLGDEHDLVIMRESMPKHSDDKETKDLLHSFFGLLDRRVFELQAEAQAIGCRVYADKPKNFIRRMRRYWDTWQSEVTPSLESAQPALLANHG